MVFPGAAQFPPGQLDPMSLAEFPVIPAPVYFICQDALRIMAKAPALHLNNPFKLRCLSFVVGIEGDPVDECITVDNTHRELCAEFCRSL